MGHVEMGSFLGSLMGTVSHSVVMEASQLYDSVAPSAVWSREQIAQVLHAFAIAAENCVFNVYAICTLCEALALIP